MPTPFDWFLKASPWIQGLFGGAGATLMWEGVLKPARERRSLAHILAEEVAHNLEYTAGQRIFLESHPNQLPGDFECSIIVFSAVANRIGELPELVGEIVLLYRGLDALNNLPAAYGDALARKRAASNEKERLKELPDLEKELNIIMSVYRTGLEKAVERANQILPRLRRAATPWYNTEVWPRKPKLLDLNELATRVNRLAAQRDLEGRGDEGRGLTRA